MMETLNIIVTAYRPWDDLVYVEFEPGYGPSVSGSELARLGPYDVLRIVRHDETPATVGAMLHGWWGEHAIAADVAAGIDPVMLFDAAGYPYRLKDRDSARRWFGEWITDLDMGSAAEACDYCLFDEIYELMPDTHTWGILNGWHSVYPKRLDDKAGL